MTEKIVDKIKKKIEEGTVFYSFEYFPPKTDETTKKLKDKLAVIDKFEPKPLFHDVTWGAGGTTSDKTLEISTLIQQEYGHVQMHLTCTNMHKEKIDYALKTAKEKNIRNLCALRGDPPKGEEKWTAVEGGFHHAADLIAYIKKNYPDYFGIAVAGYPEGHTEATSLDDDIKYLKAKVDAGGDFVITQLFYDVDGFFSWRKKCQKAGIKVPIVPGIMPIGSYAGFKRMVGFCKTKVPKDLEEKLEEFKDDEVALKDFGVTYVANMCKKLVEGGVPGLHFYTLNDETLSRRILQELNMLESTTGGEKKGKQNEKKTDKGKTSEKKGKTSEKKRETSGKGKTSEKGKKDEGGNNNMTIVAVLVLVLAVLYWFLNNKSK